jgi:hypothetical protein
VIKRGSTRYVIKLGPIALKIGIGEAGARHNRSEWETYRNAPPWRKDMLCPVLWCSRRGKLLMARRAVELTQDEFVHIGATGLPKWDYQGLGDVECPFEAKASNWGRLSGKLVALDYSDPRI